MKLVTVTVLKTFDFAGMRYPAGASVTVGETLAAQWAKEGNVKLPDPAPAA